MWGTKKVKDTIEIDEHVFLPADGNGIGFTMKPGTWNDFNVSELRNVADHLPIIKQTFDGAGSGAEHNPGSGGIDEFSIPSPWAKFILFETVLYNNGLDNLHEKIKSEWRGFIAFLALSALRGINVSFEEIVVSESKGGFYGILAKTKPSNYIFVQDKEWNKLYTVKMDNLYNVGMLSNSTFVCTPYEYDMNTRVILERRISWFKKGKFTDPVEHLDEEYTSALIYWLQEVRDRIKEHSSTNLDLNAIAGLFEAFISELEDHLKLIGKTKRLRERYKYIDAPHAAFSMAELMKFTISGDVDETSSDVALFSNNRLVIVSRKMWGVDTNDSAAEKIHVFGNVTLRDYPEDFVSGKPMFGHYNIPNGLTVFKAEDLFWDDLYLVSFDSEDSAIDDMDEVGGRIIKNGYESILTYRGSKFSVIWPINKILLEHIDPAEMKENIRVKVIKDGRIEISMKIKLTGPSFLKRPNQKFIEYEISKAYDYKDSEYIENFHEETGRIRFNDFTSHNLPNIAIWPYQTYSAKVNPDIEDNVWSKYYTFISTDYDSKLNLQPIFKSGESNDYTLNKIAEKFINCKVIHSKSLPHYIACKFKELDNGQPETDIGVIFLKHPQRVFLDNAKNWKIGLDFGTTSTTAFYDDGHKKEFIKFGSTFEKSTDGKIDIKNDVSDDIYFITNPKDSTFNDSVYKYFMPYAYLNKRIYLSMYEKLRDLDSSESNDYLKAFYDGHIFYHTIKGRFDASSENIFKDLKWGDELETKIAREYLKQILLQCVQKAAANGVSTIDFRFSYPTALGENRKNIYVQSLKAAIDSLREETGLNMDIGYISTESLAAALFFQHMEGTAKPLPNEVFVCMDIGGGSTDISIWKKDEDSSNKLQSSFKFASRNIFLRTLCKSFLVFEKLIVQPNKHDNNVLKLILKNSKVTKDFMSQVEYELFENEVRIENDRTNIMGTDYYVDFIKLVSMGFLGMVYYVSTLIVYLLQKGELNDVKTVKFYLSGNGAKLYKWVLTCVSQESLESSIITLLEKHGVEDVKIYFNEKALKTEAAIGLLYVDNSNNDLSKEKMISGEKFSIKDKNGKTSVNDWDVDLLGNSKEILERFLANEIEIKPDSELSNLKSFIGLFNRIFEASGRKAQIILNPSMQNHICGSIEKKILDLKKDGRLDPLFILGIYSLLELMHSENEKKYSQN